MIKRYSPDCSHEKIQLTMEQTAGGRIPILHTGHREDFVSLVRALAMKNEPGNIPNSMGACMVKGLNNRDRVRRSGMPLSLLVPHKDLYQDKLIILSGGPYSGVSAPELNLTADEWERMSLDIRREHECTHYLTQRLYGSARNYLFDELIADYAGIREAAGVYKADWFLRFIGLEEYPEYRRGGRLENYLGEPPLSEKSFTLLQQLAYFAARGLEQLDAEWQDMPKEKRITSLCAMALEELVKLGQR